MLSGLAQPHLHEHTDPHQLPPPSGKVKFVKNLGQWEAKIKYAADIPGGRAFVEADRLTFVLANLSHLHDAFFHGQGPRDQRIIPISGHAFQILFPGSNPNAPLIPDQPYTEYHNYFLGDDPSRWQGNVPLYAQLTYSNLWPGIDLVLYGQDQTIKYDFVVRHGNTDQIKMSYQGVDGITQTPQGGLQIHTSVGTIQDQAPISYTGAHKTTLPSAFSLAGTTVGFAFPQPTPDHWGDLNWTQSSPLVIDPSLIFGSFTGSTADNFGYTATYDTSGNLYGGGIAFNTGYPTTLGAFQTAYGGGGPSPFGGGFDISISKFSPNGTALLYSTYLGGSLNEQPHSLITNDDGELVVYGRTNSLNFPTTAGAVQPASAGGSDIIVTKFNATGSALVGSTYLGGAGEDGMNVGTNFFANSLYQNYGDDARGEIMIDPQGNIYIASCTQSNNFPTTPGVVQPVFGGGLQDACVFKLNPTCTALTWSTYLGGNGNDATFGIKVDGAGNVFVAGGTESSNYPTTPGTINTTYQGSIDGFITRLNPSATAIAASTYIGTAAYDQCYFIELDQNGDVYVVGQTHGNFPVTPGVYSDANAGQFIAKYSSTLNTTFFSTVFGKGGNAHDISPTAFLVDRCGFIYVSGWGGNVNFSGNTAGLTVSAGAFQTTTDGSDIYLIVFEPDAVGIEYATFYGGAISTEHVDGGTSRFDKQLVVYQAVCAGCGGNDDFPSVPGVVSQTNNSFNCNLGVFKFAFEPQDVRADYTSMTYDSCAPFPVTFTNTSSGGSQYIWDFGDGSPTVTTFHASHIYTNPGTYTVTLVAIDSNSCNFSDTAVATVTVYANPIVLVNQTDTVCAGASVQLTASGGQFYDWTPGNQLSDSTIANPIANPTQNTTYTVIVSDTNGCVDTASITVAVSFFVADAGPPTSFCEGTGGAQLQAGAVSGGLAPYYYTWWCDTTNTYCGLDSTFDNDPIGNPTQTTWYYLQVQDSRGCLSDVDSTLVEVLPNPIADAGPDQFICQPPAPGALLHGTISGAPGPYTYYWINSYGLNDSTLLNPYARPDTTTIYTLIAISANGCTSNPTTVDTLSTVTVHVNPRPIADAGPEIHSCLGDTVTIQGIGYGAGPDYTFEWSPSTGLDDSTLTNPQASPPITHTYTLTVWSNGCPSIGDTMTLWVHTLPTPSAGNIVEICLGDSGQLDAFGAGDSSAHYTYNWQPPMGLDNPTAENPLASPDSSLWYYLEVTSSWGCKSPLDSVLLRVKPTPIAEAGPNLEFCAGDSLNLLGSYYYTSTDSAPISEIYYTWIPATQLSDSTIAQPIVWPSGSTIYHLEVRYNTCSTSDSVLVSVSPELGAWAQTDTMVICGGDSVQLMAGGGAGGASITWSPSTGLSDPNSFNPMAAPGDTITYTANLSEGGCSEQIPVHLSVIPRPTASFLGSDPQGCPPHPVTLLNTSQGATAYVWDFGDGYITNALNASHTYTAPGEYTVRLIALAAGACADTATTYYITVGDTAIVDFVSDPEFPATLPLPNAEVQFINRSVNALTYIWDFGDGIYSTDLNPLHIYTNPGEYYVQLTVRSGSDCPGSIIHGPFVVRSPELFIPNVFSPNGDGINDGFRPDYTGDQPYVFQLFDRWGTQLFLTQNKTDFWWGQDLSGSAAPEGVYFYHVKTGEKEYAGEVTLLR